MKNRTLHHEVMQTLSDIGQAMIDGHKRAKEALGKECPKLSEFTRPIKKLIADGYNLDEKLKKSKKKGHERWH